MNRTEHKRKVRNMRIIYVQTRRRKVRKIIRERKGRKDEGY